MQRLWIFALLLVGVMALGQEEVVVIRLGEHMESVSDFGERYEIALYGVAAQQGVPVDEALRAQLEPFKGRFLEQRVMEVVLLNEARQRGLAVTEEEVQAEIDRVSATLAEGETLAEMLPQVGFRDEARFRAYLGEQLLTSKLVEALSADISVGGDEVRAAYESRQAEFATPEQACARHILLETEAEANELLAELQNGADFAELAAEHSTDPGSAAQGGDLGCFAREMMVAPFAEAAFGAEVDTVAGPVESEFGYHLIQVYERREADALPFEQIAPQLKAQLEQEAFLAKLEELRTASGVEVFPEALGLEGETQ